jgi:phosphate butyryltransferase
LVEITNMFKRFTEIRARARELGKTRVAVVLAEDEGSVQLAVAAEKEGIAHAILIGDAAKIKAAAGKCGKGRHDFEIIDCRDEAESAAIAVKLVRENKIDMILKGLVDTAVLMKAVLDKKTGIRGDRILSDVFVFEDPLWDDRGGKLTAMSDGAITPAPTLEQKRQILENAVEVLHRLGCPVPKVAVISGTEKVNDKIQSTVDARKLAEMNRRGEITGCIVEGPLAMDVVGHRWCAEMKGIESRVSGEADILIMPMFEAGNVFGKTMVFYMNRQIGHVMVGAKAPLLINSRTDSSELKLNSIALTSVVLRSRNHVSAT